MTTSRRTFLTQTSAAAAVMLLSPQEMVAAKKSQLTGLQLSTVKEEASNDVYATLKLIAAVSYNNVELLGYTKRIYSGKTIRETRELPDKYKLKRTSAHVAINDFLFNNDEDSLKKTIEDAKTIRNFYA